jgi:pyrimidine-nucleoside phosphorylase
MSATTPSLAPAYRVTDLIRKKRDGLELTREEIQFLIAGYTSGEVPEYQVSAWLMAVVLKGMSRDELAALTESMLHSGQVLDLSDLPGCKVDKHSTGGVGDKTSMVVAPIVAAAGLKVPMISGRGLGHTGGTLDKLESIPHFNVNLSLADFRRVLQACGCALAGQTAEIAPADKKMYALRDVTGTVESPYLICASIMSKKLAEGIDALVLDVKTGSGAFMKKEDDAIALAQLMVETGNRMGKRVVALITDMDQPLGRYVGNALEVKECLHVLYGRGPNDLRDLCLELSAWMLFAGERVATLDAGRALAADLIRKTTAREKFRHLIELQGGDPSVVDDPTRLPHARHTFDLPSHASGYVSAMNCELIGMASMVLGGGREKKDDTVDPAVGLVLHKKIGDHVVAGEPLCSLHYNSELRLADAKHMIAESYIIEPAPPAARHALIRRVISEA